jgi:hypothetical protein
MPPPTLEYHAPPRADPGGAGYANTYLLTAFALLAGVNVWAALKVRRMDMGDLMWLFAGAAFCAGYVVLLALGLGVRWALLSGRPGARDPLSGRGLALSLAAVIAGIAGNIVYTCAFSR